MPFLLVDQRASFSTVSWRTLESKQLVLCWVIRTSCQLLHPHPFLPGLLAQGSETKSQTSTTFPGEMDWHGRTAAATRALPPPCSWMLRPLNSLSKPGLALLRAFASSSIFTVKAFCGGRSPWPWFEVGPCVLCTHGP